MNDPDNEVDLLILQRRDRNVVSVHETGADKPICNPRHLSRTMSADGITSMTRVASCSITPLSRRQELRKFRSSVNLVSGRSWTDLVTRLSSPRDWSTSTRETKTNSTIAVGWSCKSTNVKQIGHFSQRLLRLRLYEACRSAQRRAASCVDRTCGSDVDINKGENRPFYRSRLFVQEHKRQADWSFFTACPPLEALRSLLICATAEELSNDVGQPVAWSAPVVLMLIDVRQALFYSAARRKVFVELPAETCTDRRNVSRWLRSMRGCRDAGHDLDLVLCRVVTNRDWGATTLWEGSWHHLGSGSSTCKAYQEVVRRDPPIRCVSWRQRQAR